MFGYGTHMQSLGEYDSWSEWQKAAMISSGKAQNRWAADVNCQVHSLTPVDKGASSHRVVLVEEQQPDSTTWPDVRPKDTASIAPTAISAGIELTMQELLVPRTLQAFFWHDEVHSIEHTDKSSECHHNQPFVTCYVKQWWPLQHPKG